LTYDALGRVVRGTEEISASFSQMAFAAQNVTTPYVQPVYNVNDCSLQDAVATLSQHTTETERYLASMSSHGQSDSDDLLIPARKSMAFLLDDCENGAQV